MAVKGGALATRRATSRGSARSRSRSSSLGRGVAVVESSSLPSMSIAGKAQSSTASQQGWSVSSGTMCHFEELRNMFCFLGAGELTQVFPPKILRGTSPTV